MSNKSRLERHQRAMVKLKSRENIVLNLNSIEAEFLQNAKAESKQKEIEAKNKCSQRRAKREAIKCLTYNETVQP